MSHSQDLQHQRIASIDATKGLLVIFMVVYHSINYTEQYHLAFKYLAFLPPSFILIVGMLLSALHLKQKHDPTNTNALKYLKRGTKLLAIFLVLNILALLVSAQSFNEFFILTEQLVENAVHVFITGTEGRLAFEILLPISYFIILSPLLILTHNHSRYAVIGLALFTIISAIVLDIIDSSWPNLNLVGAGMLGLVIGFFGSDNIRNGCRNLPVILAIYAFIFTFGYIVERNTAIQLLEAASALALIYCICLKLNHTSWTKSLLVLLGRYSLISYISQIAILQFLSLFIGRPEIFSTTSLSLFLLTTFLMIAIVLATDWARKYSQTVSLLYRFLFA